MPLFFSLSNTSLKNSVALGIKSEGNDAVRTHLSALIVVFCSMTDAQTTASARKLWESAASQMLLAIIHPFGTAKLIKLPYIFDRIEYLLTKERNMDMQLCPASRPVSAPDSLSSCDPADFARGISNVVGRVQLHSR